MPARMVKSPRLNGKPIFLAGWLDQSWWPDGKLLSKPQSMPHAVPANHTGRASLPRTRGLLTPHWSGLVLMVCFRSLYSTY